MAGTLDELAAIADDGAWLRVYVRERPRAGLRETVQEMLPRALEVRIDPEILAEVDPSKTRAKRPTERTPAEMFADYLSAQGHADPDVAALFDTIYAEIEA